jgi:C4-type Zn-finger protein
MDAKHELDDLTAAKVRKRPVNRVSVNECAQCRADIIAAPEWSEHLSDYCVRHYWSCDACGYRFEDTVYLSREPADAS